LILLREPSLRSPPFVLVDQDDVEFRREKIPKYGLGLYFTVQLLRMYLRHIVDDLRRLAGKAHAEPLKRISNSTDGDWWELV
jgi:hypothetical protein